ncbi:hypothetical protein EAI_13636, partial [Harpegnathos saltator]
ASCLREVSLELVPEVVQRGQEVVLRCHYDLENAPLYSLKWYRGRYEFYRFSPSEDPDTKVFNITGIHVDRGNSNKSQVTLFNVDFPLSGTFSCEVTADAPTFSTASGLKNLTVVVATVAEREAELDCVASGTLARKLRKYEIFGRPLKIFGETPSLPGGGPVIASERERYDPGDTLRANCSLPLSRPPVQLSFTLNNLPVSDVYRHDCRIIEL